MSFYVARRLSVHPLIHGSLEPVLLLQDWSEFIHHDHLMHLHQNCAQDEGHICYFTGTFPFSDESLLLLEWPDKKGCDKVIRHAYWIHQVEHNSVLPSYHVWTDLSTLSLLYINWYVLKKHNKQEEKAFFFLFKRPLS